MPRKVYSDPKAFIKAYRRERRQELINKYSLQVAVLLMIVACGLVLQAYTQKEAELTAELEAHQAQQKMDTRGCIASAYQATKNGGDLEANLAVCKH